MPHLYHHIAWLPLLTLMLSVAPSVGRGDTADRCRSISDEAARLRCYDSVLPKSTTSGASRSIGAWRLLHTPDPRGGPDAISLVRAADPLRSEPEFVGLMLRCGPSEIEVLTVIIPPLPPRAKPTITIGSGSHARQVAGRVTPPGAAILLPTDISAEARNNWTRRDRIEFAVSHDGTTLNGTVDLEGFARALQALTTDCATRPPAAVKH